MACSLRAFPPWWSWIVISSWNGFPVIPDTYARVLNNSEMQGRNKKKKVFQSFPKKLKCFVFLNILYLIILSLIVLDLKKVSTVSVVFPAATFLSVLAWSCSPSHPPTVCFVVIYFFYMVSQVIPNSSFPYVGTHLNLNLLTHTSLFHWVNCTNCHTDFPSQYSHFM